jgi:hypothetical protein
MPLISISAATLEPPVSAKSATKEFEGSPNASEAPGATMYATPGRSSLPSNHAAVEEKKSSGSPEVTVQKRRPFFCSSLAWEGFTAGERGRRRREKEGMSEWLALVFFFFFFVVVVLSELRKAGQNSSCCACQWWCLTSSARDDYVSRGCATYDHRCLVHQHDLAIGEPQLDPWRQ